MSLIEFIVLILCYSFFLLATTNFFTGGRTFNEIDKAIRKYRKRKHPQLFFYINCYNKLADSCNEIFSKEYLPIRNKVDYFYDNVKYFPQPQMKSRQLEVERQKQLLQDSKEEMKKVWNNAQEYYELIMEYTKKHKILWANEYLDGFPF